MKIIEDNGLKILVPEKDHVLYNVKTNMYCDKMYLGKFDVMENYREIHKSLQPGRTKEVEELQNTINEQELAISKLAEQLAQLASLIQTDPANKNNQ